MTYYFTGPVVAAHIIMAMIAPFIPGSVAATGEYCAKCVPLVLTFIAVHVLAYRTFALKPAGTPVDIRGALLALATWPVYSLAFITALLRTPARFVSTPKYLSLRRPLRLVVPQLITVFFLVVSLSTAIRNESAFPWTYALFATVLIALHVTILPATLASKRSLGPAISRN
jgi:hypothetical protein